MACGPALALSDKKRARERLSVRTLATLAALTSAASMVIEISTLRLLAPYFGTSLYVWAASIGVVLTALTVGHALSARLSDRWAGRSLLTLILALAALACFLSLPLAELVPVLRSSRFGSLPLRVTLSAALLACLPTLFCGLAGPLLARLFITDSRRVGTSVGRLSAAAAVGAIVGTLSCGLILIEAIGTRRLLLVTGLALALGASVTARGLWWRQGVALSSLALGLLLLGAGPSRLLQGPCMVESAYYCIRVVDRTVEDDTLRALVLDNLVHSLTRLGDPSHLEYGYERIFADLTAYLVGSRQQFAVLVIGGGGYTFPRYLATTYPVSRVDVIEIDPTVARLAYQFFGVSQNLPIRTFTLDARQFFLDERPVNTYDLIFGDAFSDLTVPYHLTTYEFHALVRQGLTTDGYYVANVIDELQVGGFLRAYLATLREVFPSVQVFYDRRLANRYLNPNQILGRTPLTYVVVAGPRPLDPHDLETRLTALGRQPTGALLSADRLAHLTAGATPHRLTDDYAPVENLLAPVFRRRDE
ncbi:MAG: hypothetical protein C4294_05710 [Nitrospiraceae bacterium]